MAAERHVSQALPPRRTGVGGWLCLSGGACKGWEGRPSFSIPSPGPAAACGGIPILAAGQPASRLLLPVSQNPLHPQPTSFQPGLLSASRRRNLACSRLSPAAGFADIPAGPSCPYVLRRGILGSAPVAQLAPRAEPEEDSPEAEEGTGV